MRHIHGPILGKESPPVVQSQLTSPNEYISPPLTNANLEEYPIVICEEIGGHDIYRMYLDGQNTPAGSPGEVSLLSSNMDEFFSC
ncbi:hypothetical protein Tco_1458529 [Tanacetum coccineum]